MNTTAITSKKLNTSDIETNTADANVLAIYLKQINEIPMMTHEEEVACAQLAAKGDRAAKNRLVTANLRFAVKVAKKYQNQGLPLADLISEANVGLMNAVDRFDVDKGFHFISYAVWWIRQAILKALCEKTRVIRLPLNRVNDVCQIEKIRRQTGNHATTEEEIRDIAALLDFEPEYVREMMIVSRDILSLDAPTTSVSDSESGSFGDYIEDKLHKTPDEYAEMQTMKRDINQFLDRLSNREAEVIRYRFGLDGNNPMSLKEIGDIFHVTKERVRQIEKKALYRLQTAPDAMRLESYVA